MMSRSTRKKQLIVVGICGVTCGGKSTTTTQLKSILQNISVFSQDDYFLDVEDPRHIWIPELNHINFDVITSLDMEKMCEDIRNFITVNNFIEISYMDKIIATESEDTEIAEDIVNIVCKKMDEENVHLLVIEGFSIFNYEPMLNLFHLKFYFVLDKVECFKRRIERVYDPPDCPGYFEKCAWPEHINQLTEVKKMLKDVHYLDGTSKNAVEKILRAVFQFLSK